MVYVKLSSVAKWDTHPEYLALTMKKKYRFIMLFFMCIFSFGACFCYDYPACLEIQIEEEFNVKHRTYGLLYTVYAIPNLILPLFGGLLFDYIGARNGLMIYTAIVVLG